MKDRVPGEIVALLEVWDPGAGGDDDGCYRLTALCAGGACPAVGVLVAPKNGAPGVIGFEPIARLEEVVKTDDRYQSLLDHAAPTVAPGIVDPNDPRGIRGAGPRRPGMRG